MTSSLTAVLSRLPGVLVALVLVVIGLCCAERRQVVLRAIASRMYEVESAPSVRDYFHEHIAANAPGSYFLEVSRY